VSPTPAGLWRYLREAFLYRWNLLFFLGGTAAAVLSPFPDGLLPIVCAAELVYLGGLTALPRFRAAIDARAHAERAAPEPGAAASQQALADVVRALDPPARQRFERLRARCLDMQRLAQGVGGAAGGGTSRADEIRAPALDRLLWAFLRLLASQQALRRFLSSADEAQIQHGVDDLRVRQEEAKKRGDERIVRSVSDAIATSELRLQNFRKAASNAEFVGVELDRIEGKIQAISEMAVSHQDPDYISSQVDSVAESMAHTEAAIRELHQITGLGEELSATPAILSAGAER